MLSRNSAPEQTWKRCGENLVKYTPSGTYYVRVRVAGKLHVKSLETPVLTVARQRLNDEIHKLRARAASVMAVRAGKMRVADAVAIYRERLEADAHIKLSTRKYYEQVLTALLRSWPSLAETDVQRLSERDCRDWAAKVFREFSGTRANNTVMVLRNVLEIAVEAGALYSNPARALGRAKLRAKDLLLPSREQFIHFEKEIRGGGGRHSRNCADFVQFVAFSGCRLSEAIGVTWRDVDFNKSEITIRGDAITGTKNSEVRRVPMIPELRSLLQRLRHERPEETNDTPILLVREAQKSMDRAAAKVGMRRITHHDLRHLFATICIESGVDIPTVSRWLGHKDGGALCMKTYGHLRQDHSLAQAQRVSFGMAA
jgi:integrase